MKATQPLIVFWTMRTDKDKTEAFALTNPDVLLYLVPPDGSQCLPLRSTQPSDPLAAGVVFVSANVPSLQLRRLLGSRYPEGQIVYPKGAHNREHRPVRSLRAGSVAEAIKKGREMLRSDGARLRRDKLRAQWQQIKAARRARVQPIFIPRAFRA
tara:strand:+ start:242 stop:706 length:465 start_codon:yes stop_codon:yes gene_type:complete